MKKLLTCFIIVIFTFLVVSCGQSGRLYLPCHNKQSDGDPSTY